MSGHKTVLVTGGAGFIGSEFVKLLVSRGYRPVVVDKLTYAGDLRRKILRWLEVCVCRVLFQVFCDKMAYVFLVFLRRRSIARPIGLTDRPIFLGENCSDRLALGIKDSVEFSAGTLDIVL